MNEMKLAVWRFAASSMPAELNTAAMMDIDMSSHPELVNHLADWDPISHTVGMIDSDILLTVLLARKVEAPDTAEGI